MQFSFVLGVMFQPSAADTEIEKARRFGLRAFEAWGRILCFCFTAGMEA